MELTKSAKRSIAVIYKEYESRRNRGVTKGAATYFDGYAAELEQLHKQVDEDVPELKAAGFITPDIVGGFTLNDKAIIFMENQTAETVKEWIFFFTQFIP